MPPYQGRQRRLSLDTSTQAPSPNVEPPPTLNRSHVKLIVKGALAKVLACIDASIFVDVYGIRKRHLERHRNESVIA